MANVNQFLIVVCSLFITACNSIDTALYQKQMLDSLKESENRVIERLAALELNQTDNSAQNIQTLKTEIDAIKTQVTQNQSLLEDVVARQKELTVNPKASSNTISQTTATKQVVINNTGNYVLGALEKVTIEAINQSFDARVDTGAETSSINAMDIEVFERNGEDWVRFHVIDEEKEASDANWVEAPIVRYVNIRQASVERLERRAVVSLWTKLGDMRSQNEFSLADRSQMTHPVLLGREFIRDVAVVDVSREFLQSGQE